MAVGMTRQMFEAGYDGKIHYAGFDIDPKGIAAAKKKLSAIQNVSVSGLEVVDFRDTDSLDGTRNDLSI